MKSSEEREKFLLNSNLHSQIETRRLALKLIPRLLKVEERTFGTSSFFLCGGGGD